MKFLNSVLLLVLAAGAQAAIFCVQGTDGTAAGTECTGGNAAATQCKGPKFEEYAGYAEDPVTVEYGCGTCTDANICTECTNTADDVACNGLTLAADFHCYTHAYDTDAYKPSEDAATCKRKDGTDIMCNEPIYGSSPTGQNDYTSAGCGPCKALEKQAGNCQECTTDSCNKAPADYQCYDYSWVTDKWVAAEELTTCERQFQTDEIMCNAPNYDKAKENDFTKSSSPSCGPCAVSAEKDAENCLECTTDQCNNSPVVTISFVLATVSALIFMM